MIMFEFTGLSEAEYKDVVSICQKWLDLERRMFSSADRDDIKKSAFYNIVTLHPLHIPRMLTVLKSTDESRSETRLLSTFMVVKTRLGDKKIKQWTKSVRNEMVTQFNFNIKDTDDFLRSHPYVILIPILTVLYMEHNAR
jgi:hypothetical protein